MLKYKKLTPNIVKQVSLDEVGLCHDNLETGQARGPAVCLPWKRVPRSNWKPSSFDSPDRDVDICAPQLSMSIDSMDQSVLTLRPCTDRLRMLFSQLNNSSCQRDSTQSHALCT